MARARQAWLILGGRRLNLDDPVAGYVMTELDIGYPEVREVVDNNPDRDGVNDRTRLAGSRVVTAVIRAWPGGGVKIDDIARLFGPFTWPGGRPELHWILDTADRSERMLTLRAADSAAPMGPPSGREIHLGWVAPDPVAYDPATRTAVGRPETDLMTGRRYDLTFDRVYPAGGIFGESAVVIVAGDVPARPRIRIHGPITAPAVILTKHLTIEDPVEVVIRFAFDEAFRVEAGHWVEINGAARQVVEDTGARLEGRVDWSESTWPVLESGYTWTVALLGSSTSQITQAVVTWREGFLAA
jgi:hypothetical protein